MDFCCGCFNIYRYCISSDMASKLKFSNDFKMRIIKDSNFIYHQNQRMSGVDYKKYKH